MVTEQGVDSLAVRLRQAFFEGLDLGLGIGYRVRRGRILFNNIPTTRKIFQIGNILLYPLRVANSPHPDTVTVSFTMPREMAAALNRRAKMDLTNKSDVIRRALLAFLPPSEAAAIRASVLKESPGRGKRSA